MTIAEIHFKKKRGLIEKGTFCNKKKQEVKQIMDNKQLINNIIYKLKLLKEKQEKRIKNAS